MIKLFKDKRLGIEETKRQYDLPLNRDESGDFLMSLVGLMTFLAVMALSASFVFSGMAERWSSGLENRLTIEIPAEMGKDQLRDPSDIQALEDKVAGALRHDTDIQSFNVMSKDDIQNLISPWLGKDAVIDSMPLPGLISVELKSDAPNAVQDLKQKLADISGDISLDTHETWLRDLLNLTNGLRLATLIVTLIIACTTIAAVSGGARARMAIYSKDVELLHLMGANDEYITRQFQRHSLILAFKGGVAGTIGAFIVIGPVHFFTGGAELAMLPDFTLQFEQIIILLMTPVSACIIAALTARLTVMRALSRMP